MKKLSVCLLTTFIFGAQGVSRPAFADAAPATPAATAAAANASAISEARSSASDLGYDEEAALVPGLAASALSAISGATPPKPNLVTLATELKEAADYYARFHGACTKSQATASWLCREKTSPKLQETMNSINMMASLISGVAVKDSCDTMGKIMRLGQAGLTAYTVACSAARATCESSCSSVYTNLQRILASPLIKNPAMGELAQGHLNQIKGIANKDNGVGDANENKAVSLKNQACTYEYTNMIVNAGVGIASLISSFKQASACGDAADGTAVATTPTAAVKATCEKPENAQLPECLCLANPRLPGCANTLQKAGEASSSNFSAMSSPNAGSGSTGGSGSGIDLSSDPNRDPASANKSADSSGVGAPAGGGGAGLGGGGGGFGGGAAGAGGAGEKKGLSANILGGGSGGGGGGGSWGSGGSSSSDNAKLRPYLPGGEKDPNKMAGQQNWTKEVTGQGGKSNWEKVRDRYRDNNSSLLKN